MNIDEMPAGRELDVLVAENVMGWVLCGESPSFIPEYWHRLKPEVLAAYQERRYYGIPSKYHRCAINEIPDNPFVKLPHYSTDDAAACAVLNYMRSSGYSYSVSSIGGQHGITCTFWGGSSGIYFRKDGHHAITPTFSESVSRAALKTVAKSDP
jgi:hypothetical protein